MYMIGQKGFSNTHNNPNEAIFSGSTPTPPPAPEASAPVFGAPDPNAFAAPTPAKPRSSINIKTILVAVAAALVGAGIAVGVMLLINRGTSEPTTTVKIYDGTPGNDGTETEAETLAEFDQKIDQAKDEEETFDLTLAKAAYDLIIEDYDAALAVLNTIEKTSLGDYDLYRLYEHYAGAYEGKGNTSEASRYHALADDAAARDLSSASEGVME